MKTAKAGLVNYLSFIKTSDITIDDFDLVLKASVGTIEYTFNSIQDLYHLSGCRDFFVLPLDILTTEVVGGEYTLELYNNSVFRGSYLINIIGFEYEKAGTGIYDNVVNIKEIKDYVPEFPSANWQQLVTQWQLITNTWN